MKNIQLSPSTKKKLFFILVLIVFVLLAFYINKERTGTDTQDPTLQPVQQEVNVSDLKTAPLSPLASTSVSNEDEVFGINRKDGSLVRFKDGTETTIYSGKVKAYSIQQNTALILDERNLSEIIILNLNNGTQTKIILSSVSPVISVSLAENLKTVYFLAGFDISKKVSGIYSVPLGGGVPQRIGETDAQSLTFLSENRLLLFEKVHDENKSVASFYDIANKKVVLTKSCNSFQLSPDKRNVLLQSTNIIEVVDINGLKTKSASTQDSNRSVFHDNNSVVLFRNTEEGVNYAILTLEPFALTSFSLLVKGSSINSAFGFLGDTLYWQDYKDNIYSTPIAFE